MRRQPLQDKREQAAVEEGEGQHGQGWCQEAFQAPQEPGSEMLVGD